MSYRLIALDIDGTIRSPDYPLSERTKQTLARVTETGAHVTLATGRMFRAALDSTRGLALRSPIASFQGAHVADPITGEVLWHKPLKSSMTKKALCAIDPWGLEVMAYHDDQVYIRELTPRLKSYGERNNVVVHVVGDFGFKLGDGCGTSEADDGLERRPKEVLIGRDFHGHGGSMPNLSP